VLDHYTQQLNRDLTARALLHRSLDGVVSAHFTYFSPVNIFGMPHVIVDQRARNLGCKVLI